MIWKLKHEWRSNKKSQHLNAVILTFLGEVICIKCKLSYPKQMSVLKTKDTILKNKMLAKGFAGYFSGNKTYTFSIFRRRNSNQEAASGNIFERKQIHKLPAAPHNFPFDCTHVMFTIVLISLLIKSLSHVEDSLTYLLLATNGILQSFQTYQK